MIITHIIGGLGNQMFQYAAGRALAFKNPQPFLLDTSDFADYKLHQGFELARVFDGKFDIATSVQRSELLGWRSGPFMQKWLRRRQFAVLRGGVMVVEPHFHYWPEFEQISGDCYLVGYWQSELYFKHIESSIRADFTFRQPLSEKNQKIVDEITRCSAISLHVRRGDYVKNTNTLATHGLCSLDYYRAAIQYLAERVENPIFYIFSDDISWVKDNLKVNFKCEYIDHNHGAESYNDMRLMSLCRHHIIANSSFSWWGAWLNSNPEKIVVAPRQWFANDNDVRDLFPEGWVTL